jgi:hypothetical protein
MGAVDLNDPEPWLAIFAGVGIVAGLVLLVRGLAGYRTQLRVADIASSAVDSIAAGEVRVSGTIEPAELTLVSLLQSRDCVYYRSSVGDPGEYRQTTPDLTEERSVGFRVRDDSGSLRVFPRAARFDAPLCFEGETGSLGDEPVGLDLRRGGATRAMERDLETQAAELLRVRGPYEWSLLGGVGDRHGRRQYHEWRLEPGDAVTVVGWAVPFGDLADPVAANLGDGFDTTVDDPEVAADLAEARAAGILAGDAASAWGNAAIPGFGIGRPASEPSIDPAATRLPLATAEERARIQHTFEIAPETLVLAASDEVPLLIAYGTPGAVVERGQTQLIVGLLGAVVAIASAMVLAVTINGGIPR